MTHCVREIAISFTSLNKQAPKLRYKHYYSKLADLIRQYQRQPTDCAAIQSVEL
jgi:hypothetical protein